ncbi:hypothetical protein [Acidocella sp.]|uniref:hypothetical protein n=1 Tax=Acidocella sp. TaxID=50710 RepID=UPI002612E620|nr:hypothetical protein [Acidocella sp.]
MNLPFSLPDWMPGWAILALAVPALLWFLAFLLVPFSTIGLKARLEALEGQVEAMHEDIRVMAMRASGALPPLARQLDPYDDVPHFGALKRGRAEPRAEAAPPPESPRRAPIPTPQPGNPPPGRERLTPLPPAMRPRREPRLD